MALFYAQGPVRETTGIPSSAFSRGDLVMFDSASSLSRVPAEYSSASIVGVAMASSLESIDDQVPYIAVAHGTTLWSDATTGSQFTRGELLDFEYTGANFFVTTSANTPIALIDPFGASDDVIDSNTSRVRIYLDPSNLAFR